MTALTTAMNELKAEASSNTASGKVFKGAFLSKAIDDITFATVNANAAINLSNGLPATQPKPPERGSKSAPAPASEPSAAEISSWKDLFGPLLLLAVLVAFGAVQTVRNRGQG